MPLRNYLDKVRRYFPFTWRERIHLAIVTVVFAFIFSFREWGSQAFDARVGLQNFGIGIIVAAISLLVYLGCQRLVALKLGARLDHSFSWNGLLLSLASVLITNGRIGIYAATSVNLTGMEYHRLGIKPRGIGLKTYALVALAGPLGTLFFGALVRAVFPGLELADKIVRFCMLLAFWNMLPIPPLDGSRLFFASRLVYVFVFASLAGVAALAQWLGWSALFGGLAIGAAIWYFFYQQFEKQ
jgi:hypothetical protein